MENMNQCPFLASGKVALIDRFWVGTAISTGERVIWSALAYIQHVLLLIPS